MDSTAIMNQFGRTAKKFWALKHKDEPYHMGRSQWLIIEHLIRTPGISQDQLASLLNLDKTSIAKSLSKLETYGFVTRNRSLTDGRKYELYPTEQATSKRLSMNQLWQAQANKALTGMTQQDLKELSRLLNMIESNLSMPDDIFQADTQGNDI